MDSRTIGRWRAAVIAGFGLGGITIVSWGTRLPTIRAELSVGTGTIGLVLACATVGAVGGLLCSRGVIHRLGGSGALRAALLAVACALVVMAFGMAVRATIVLAAGMLVVGLGIGVLDVVINVEGAAVERHTGRSQMPLMHSGWSAGSAVGAGIGALCAAAGVTPAAQFAGLAALVAAAGVVVPRPIPATPQPDASAAPAALARGEALRRWLRGWADPRLLLIGLVLLGVDFGEGSANGWLSLATREGHGQSAALAALFVALFAACEATSRFSAGPLVDRFGRVRAVRFTTALGIAGVALFILSGAIWLVALGVVLWAVGVSMGFPLGLSAAAEGDDPAAQVSVASSVGYMANVVGPPVIGFLAESLGLLSALWLLAVLFLAAFAAARSLAPTM